MLPNICSTFMVRVHFAFEGKNYLLLVYYQKLLLYLIFPYLGLYRQTAVVVILKYCDNNLFFFCSVVVGVDIVVAVVAVLLRKNNFSCTGEMILFMRKHETDYNFNKVSRHQMYLKIDTHEKYHTECGNRIVFLNHFLLLLFFFISPKVMCIV